MKLLMGIFLVACVFPYTKFIPILEYSALYTQPTALIIGSFLAMTGIMKWTFSRLHFEDGFFLIGLSCVGVFFLSISIAYSGEWLSIQDLKYIAMYLSPIILVPLVIYAFVRYHSQSKKIIEFSAMIWLLVGLVQLLFDPNFLAPGLHTIFNVVLASGRGVLSLAPEPTHFGFQLLFFAAALILLDSKNILIWGCVLGSVILARSSSVLFVLLISAILLMIQNGNVRLWIGTIFFAIFVYLTFPALKGMDVGQWRVYQLIDLFLYSDSSVLLDASVNARLGGLIASILSSSQDLFAPHGISHVEWLQTREQILRNESYLNHLSASGWPSGYFIIIYQTGWFGLLLLWVVFKRFYKIKLATNEKLIIYAAMLVFMMQLMISTPFFSVLYGLVVSKFYLKRTFESDNGERKILKKCSTR